MKNLSTLHHRKSSGNKALGILAIICLFISTQLLAMESKPTVSNALLLLARKSELCPQLASEKKPDLALIMSNFPGIDINFLYSNRKRTALHYAAENGYTKLAKALLDKGAKFDIADSDGNTALQLAQANGHDDIVKLIEAKKA